MSSYIKLPTSVFTVCEVNVHGEGPAVVGRVIHVIITRVNPRMVEVLGGAEGLVRVVHHGARVVVGVAAIVLHGQGELEVRRVVEVSDTRNTRDLYFLS